MNAPSIPQSMIVASALLAGLLFALAVHMIGQRFGLDLGAMWSASGAETVPFRAALAWWITAAGAFAGGYVAASILSAAASGGVPPMLRYLFIGLGVLALAGAGQAASAPSRMTSTAGVLAGFAAVLLGAVMALCGAQLALRRT